MKTVRKIIAVFVAVLMLMTAYLPVTAEAAGTSYKNWVQSDASWGSIKLGSSSDTMASSGCLVTSIAMLMCHSGSADSDYFTPADLVGYLNDNDGFTHTGSLYWAQVDGFISDFNLVNYNISLSGMTRSEKTALMAAYIDCGYAVVIGTKNSGHWVALDRIENDTVYIFDPGSSYTNLYSAYDESKITRLAVFKGRSTSGSVTGTVSGLSSDTVTGIVNCSALNIRSGAGTSYSVVTSVSNGSAVTVTGSACDQSGTAWYKVSTGSKTGYCMAKYITLAGNRTGFSDTGVTDMSGTGTVNCTTLNVRSGAGTSNSVVTTISKGQSVSITGSAKDGTGTEWYAVTFTKSGKSYSGYVSAAYITVSASSSGTAETSFTGTGTVNCTTLNVRSGAGTSNSVVTTISEGQTVSIAGSAKDGAGTEWYAVTFTKNGKSYSGYVSSVYITTDGGSGQTESTSGAYTPVQAVVNCSSLNVRSGPGTQYSVTGQLSKGTSVTVTGEDRDGSNVVWYEISFNKSTGYVHSSYLTKESPVSVTGKVTCSRLNVRSGAGTDYQVLVVIPSGTEVTVTETVKDAGGSEWYNVTFTYNGTSYRGYVSAQYIS